MKEIKTCPCCGGIASIFYSPGIYCCNREILDIGKEPTSGHQIKCMTCSLKTKYYRIEKKALKVWNRRQQCH